MYTTNLLEDARQSHVECLALAIRAEVYREMAVRSTGNMSGVPGSGNKAGKQERYIIPLVDIQRRLQAQLKRLDAVTKAAERQIATLKNPRHRAVLSAYYLSIATWEEVAEALHYDVRWVYKLRDEALEILGKASA